MRSVAGGVMRHAATIAYTLKSARLAAGSVYASGARYPIRRLRTGYPGVAPVDIPQATLCTSPAGDRYFGHFLTEDLLHVMIAADFGEPIRLEPVRDWPHAPVYREAFELAWRDLAAGAFETLTFFSDYAQNGLRRRRYRDLRARLRRTMSARPPGRRVYLRRPAAMSPPFRVDVDEAGDAPLPALIERTPLNEAEVAAALERRGYQILDTASSSPRALVEGLIDAEIIVGVEGSHLMHGVYTIADDGGVLIMMPPMRPTIQAKDRYDALGIPCAIVVGEDLGSRYRIAVDDLNRALDLLESRVERGERASRRAAIQDAVT